MNSDEILELLSLGLNRHERKLEANLLEDLRRRFLAAGSPISSSPHGKEALPIEQLFVFASGQLAEEVEGIFTLRRRYSDYVKRYSRAAGLQDAQRYILEFAAELGATPRQLRGDRKAFQRWFGHDAVSERYQRLHGQRERRITFLLGRAGALAEMLLGFEGEADGFAREWSRLGLEAILKPFFAYDGDARVSTAAFRALSRALRALPQEIQEGMVAETTHQFIYRCAMHPRLDVWLQCAAIALLESLSPLSLEKVLKQRLGRPGEADDIFVRRRAVEVLGRNLHRVAGLVDVLEKVAADPSPFVRQALCDSLREASPEIARVWCRRLAREDPSPQVRAAAVLSWLGFLGRPDLEEDALSGMRGVFAAEKDAFVLKVAAHVAAEGASILSRNGGSFLVVWAGTLVGELDRLRTGTAPIPVKRSATQARERVWVASNEMARLLYLRLERYVKAMARGERQELAADVAEGIDDDTLGRVMSVLSQDDFGLDIRRKPNAIDLTRGDTFGLRLWRCLHEFRNPSPDKRQAFRHTIGRRYRGDIRVPSGILAELAETRVPGEPLFLAEEGGWRPYLPLPDDLVSALGPPVRSLRFYTAEGVTEVDPPGTLPGRLKAFARLSLRFADFAKLRNWRSNLQESPLTYLRAAADLGFVVRFRPHEEDGGRSVPVDPDVKRFFPFLLPVSFGGLWTDLKDYFVSVYTNTIFELLVFSLGATGVFVGRHIWANRALRSWRRRLPLVVGGWGTRGKSGTERLKAALFNALGYGVVSKTTGCEAMFLYAHAFQKTREMFLFRSYDKATIWEQRNVLKLAHELGCEVFLWECMALTPSYVDVLQHHWVHDDISTITNTYPDHEDLQGPAGINIPDVISVFTPRRAKLITSEEVMLPILVERAKGLETPVRRVSWIDSGLLAPDVLKRFPYDEHPSNVALVLALADELGVPRDFALKEMADRVVPDLGVLKTYPVARVRGRRLQFANGMSANERHGTISNWIRCGYHLQDPVAEPGVWITTVVNNRADRVPRSRVFARILVEDIQADRHFLIGGNLTGLGGYIRQAWEAYAPTISLWPKDAPVDPSGVLRDMASRFRQCARREQVLAKFEAMLPTPAGSHPGVFEPILEDSAALRAKLQELGITEAVDDILAHHEAHLESFREFQTFEMKLEKSAEDQDSRLDTEFRELLWRWFQRKIVVVEDYHTTGDQLNDLIARTTPPGYLNRVMGIQNIKGTGLDFVYRWQAWDACYKACAALESKDPLIVERGLQTLSSFHEYGVLCEDHVRSVFVAVKGLPTLESDGARSQLAVIEASFEAAMKLLAEKLKSKRKKASRLEKALGFLEAFFDAGDAVRRRKLADRIYRDLIAQRIGTERAALELQGLNKRQKGGWLLGKLASVRRFFSRSLGAFLAKSAK